MKTTNNDYPYYEVDPISTITDMLTNSTRKYANNLALQDLNPTPIPRVTYQELKEHVLTFGTEIGRAHV